MDRDNELRAPDAGSGPIGELQALDREVETASDLAVLKQFFYRLESIIQQNLGDVGVQDLAAKVKQRILSKGMQLKQSASSAGPATTPFPQGPSVTPYPSPGAAPPPPSAPTVTVYGAGTTGPRATPEPYPPQPAAPAAPAPAPPRAVPPAPAAAPALAWKRALMAGGLIGVVLFAGLVWLFKRASDKKAAPPSGMVSVEIRTTPPGATIRIDNEVRCTSNCTIELPPGSYQLRATLEGYDPASMDVNAQPGSPVKANLTLNAQGQIVRLFTDLQSGKVLLNGQQAGELDDGQIILERVPAGRHTLQVAGQGNGASFSFEVLPGAAPVISGPITTKNLIAVLVGSAGDRGKLHSSVTPVKVSLDGKAAGQAAGEGLDLTNLAAGDHELVVDDGKTARKMVVAFGPAPVLTAFLKLDLNAGTLVVSTGEDGATVYLDGKPYTARKTSRGQLRLRALRVGKYVVRVSKEGYLDEPEQHVEIRKGEESRVEFRLRPVPRMATLRLSGATPGTRVVLDGDPLGEVRTDGTFSASVAPGAKVIELRRDSFAPRQLKRQFNAGETVEISGADVVLESLPALVRVTVVPADARLTWRRAGELQGRPVTQNPLRLPEGTYMITGTAPGYADGSVSVQVSPGDNKAVEIKLLREKAVAPVPVGPMGMDDWEAPGNWRRQNQWRVHTGGNFVLFKPPTVQGILAFGVARLKGSRLRWFLNWVDARNYALFEMDRRSFYRKDVVNGRTQDLSKIEHRVPQGEEFKLQIEVARGSIIHRIQRGGGLEILDAWNQPNRDFTRGRFGFRIEGNDQVGLSDFSFRPQ